MYFVQDKQTDFSVVIKIRGQASEPLEVGDLSRWEIKRSGAIRGIFPDNRGG